MYNKEYTEYKCSCGNIAAPQGRRKVNGIKGPRVHSITKKPWCSSCKLDYEAKKAGFASNNDKLNQIAIKEGYISTTHKKNIMSENYKSFKYYKPTCNNQNKHLGVPCLIKKDIQKLAKKAFNKQGKIRKSYKNHERIDELKAYLDSLTVDHIDGDPSNNHIDNLQTFCLICHRLKTTLNGDHLSVGRSKMKITSEKIIRGPKPLKQVKPAKTKTNYFFTNNYGATKAEFRFKNKKVYSELISLYPTGKALRSFLLTADGKEFQPKIYKKSKESNELFCISDYMKYHSKGSFRGITDKEKQAKQTREALATKSNASIKEYNKVKSQKDGTKDFC